ncbi:MAG: ABC transporter permease, partial [Lachnospiraceae bacterium]|nr:ABC transporter permease [Lachnospiraceae bacterium]
MWKYVGKRLLQMIPILVVVAILIFTLMYFVPGDPIQILLGDSATPVQIDDARARLGLDEPYVVRLKDFVVDLCHF